MHTEGRNYRKLEEGQTHRENKRQKGGRRADIERECKTERGKEGQIDRGKK